MSAEEFTKQQYLTLREEIRACKTRVFMLLVLGTLVVPVAAVVAQQYNATHATASMPFVILVLMIAFITEQNSIIRAGRYLKEHVEPHIKNVVTWESWLESNRKLRDTDRYFFGTFLLVFLLFYVVGTGMAIESLATIWPSQYWYAATGYAVGGLWFLIVMLKHWHSCTTTEG